jgi:hypothetical protein
LKKVAPGNAHVHMKEHGELLSTECLMKDVVPVFLEKTQLMRSACESRKLRALKQNPELSFINTKLGQSRSDFFSGKPWRWLKVRLRHLAPFDCGVDGRCPRGRDSEFLNIHLPISYIVFIRRTTLAREMDGRVRNCRIESWIGLSSNAPCIGAYL